MADDSDPPLAKVCHVFPPHGLWSLITCVSQAYVLRHLAIAPLWTDWAHEPLATDACRGKRLPCLLLPLLRVCIG